MKYVKELQNRKIGHGNRLCRIWQFEIEHMGKIGEAYFCAENTIRSDYDFGILAKRWLNKSMSIYSNNNDSSESMITIDYSAPELPNIIGNYAPYASSLMHSLDILSLSHSYRFITYFLAYSTLQSASLPFRVSIVSSAKITVAIHWHIN